MENKQSLTGKIGRGLATAILTTYTLVPTTGCVSLGELRDLNRAFDAILYEASIEYGKGESNKGDSHNSEISDSSSAEISYE